MDADQRKRLAWVRLYEGHGDAGLVCRRCGISRPTLRKWWKRYTEAGIEGLKSRSRRPHRSPNQRVFEGEERLIPIKPRSPHLNGKVERSQKTDLDEFWSAVDLKADDLHQKLDEWQHFYNWHRPHTALNGKSPIDRVCDLLGRTPLTEDVEAAFDPSRERIKEQNYALDQEIRKLQ